MAPGTANAGGGGVDPLDVKPVIGNQQADYQRMMQHAANMGMAISLNWFTSTTAVSKKSNEGISLSFLPRLSFVHGCGEIKCSPIPKP